MTRDPKTCRASDPMSRAAQIMWEADCGCVPVVDDSGKPVAMITDRDISMAAYTRGEPLCSMNVGSAASAPVVTVGEGEEVATVEQIMRERRVRRLPVVDPTGHVVGIISMNDLARHAQEGPHRRGLSAEGVVKTLAAVCAPR
ncbi:MAG TPA: CBS domain-containing protein [Polyangiaceae bacterium]